MLQVTSKLSMNVEWKWNICLQNAMEGKFEVEPSRGKWVTIIAGCILAIWLFTQYQLVQEECKYC